jgi:hypothetical protein
MVSLEELFARSKVFTTSANTLVVINIVLPAAIQIKLEKNSINNRCTHTSWIGWCWGSYLYVTLVKKQILDFIIVHIYRASKPAFD